MMVGVMNLKKTKIMLVGDMYQATHRLNVTTMEPDEVANAGIKSFPASTVYMYLGQTRSEKQDVPLPGQYSKILVEGVIYYTYNVWRLAKCSEKI